MIVYRLGHSQVVDECNGLPCGPYRATPFLAQWTFGPRLKAVLDAQERLLGADCGPSPWGDPTLNGLMTSLDDCAYIESCGCDSLQSLRAWFGKHLKELGRVGFEIQRFEVPDMYVRRGQQGQVVFQHAKAVRVTDPKGEISE